MSFLSIQEKTGEAGRYLPIGGSGLRTTCITLSPGSYSTFQGKGFSQNMVPLQRHWCARFCARFPAYALFYLNIIIGYCGLGGWLLCPLLPGPGSYVASSAELPKGEQMEWAVPLPRAATWAMEPTCCLVSFVWSPHRAMSSEVLFFPFRVFRTLEKPPVRYTCLSSTFYKWENWRPEKEGTFSSTQMCQQQSWDRV